MHANITHQPDYLLEFSLLAIVVIGLVMLASAGSAIGYQKFGNAYYFLLHQITVGLLPGLVLFWLCSKLDYHWFLRYKNFFGWLTVALLAVVFIPGLGTTLGKNAHSWINLFGVSWQPAEFAKLTFVLFLAAWVSQRSEAMKNLWLGFIPTMLIIAGITGLVVLEPDFGTASIFLLIGFAIYFIEGRWKHLLIFILIGSLLFLGLLLSSSHARQRLMTFVNPASATDQAEGYQIKQALIGIGSGGFWGRGLGHSRQKFQYLPESTGDSIFSVIGEEMGFWFSILLVGLYLTLFARTIKIARNAPDKFGQLVSVGVISWLIGQAWLNICAMLGLLPLTGVPLPFISSGGTALAAGLAAVGILVNISRQTSVK